MMVKSWFYHVVEFFKDLPNSFFLNKTGTFLKLEIFQLRSTKRLKRTSLPTPGVSMFSCLIGGWLGWLGWCFAPIPSSNEPLVDKVLLEFVSKLSDDGM